MDDIVIGYGSSGNDDGDHPGDDAVSKPTVGPHK